MINFFKKKPSKTDQNLLKEEYKEIAITGNKVLQDIFQPMQQQIENIVREKTNYSIGKKKIFLGIYNTTAINAITVPSQKIENGFIIMINLGLADMVFQIAKLFVKSHEFFYQSTYYSKEKEPNQEIKHDIELIAKLFRSFKSYGETNLVQSLAIEEEDIVKANYIVSGAEKFVIAHEYGHIIAEHSGETTPENELEADRIAFDILEKSAQHYKEGLVQHIGEMLGVFFVIALSKMDEKISRGIYHENPISSHPLDDRRIEEITKRIGGELLYQPVGDEILGWFAKLEKQIVSILKKPEMSLMPEIKTMDCGHATIYDKNIERVMKMNPNDPTALKLKAHVLLKKGIEEENSVRYEEALSICNKLIKNYPNEESLLILRSEIYKELENFDYAMQDLDKACKINPESVEVQIFKAELFVRLKKTEDVLKIYEQMVQSMPKNPEKTTRLEKEVLTEILEKKRNGFIENDDRENESVFNDKILKIDPNNFHALLLKGEELLIHQKITESAKTFLKALKSKLDGENTINEFMMRDKKLKEEYENMRDEYLEVLFKNEDDPKEVLKTIFRIGIEKTS